VSPLGRDLRLLEHFHRHRGRGQKRADAPRKSPEKDSTKSSKKTVALIPSELNNHQRQVEVGYVLSEESLEKTFKPLAGDRKI
jgi:hypothetical protein